MIPLRSRRAVARLAAVAVTALIGATAGAGAASAATAEDGLWYYSAFSVDAAAAAGITGSGVSIAVIDGQVNDQIANLAGAPLTVHEPSFCAVDGATATATTTAFDTSARHGANVVEMILGRGTSSQGLGTKGVAPGAAVTFYSAGAGATKGEELRCDTTSGGDNRDSVAQSIRQAVDDGAQIVSVSIAGAATPALLDSVAYAEHKGAVIVASVANFDTDETTGWPSAANGVVAVQSMDRNGDVQGTADNSQQLSPWVTVGGPGVDVLLSGSDNGWDRETLAFGTSFATPAVAGFLADVKQKYPGATANQLIQSLVRNTGTEDHAPKKSSKAFGYGIASLTNMLAVDPTKYPDTNPLVSTASGARPTAAQIAAGSTKGAAASASPSSSGSPSTPGAASAVPGALIVAGVVGLLIIAAIVIVIVVVVRRSGRRDSTPPAGGRS